MRIRIIQRPHSDSIDGIRLDRFEVGYQYEVGNSVAALMLAEGWAEPVQLDEPALIPFSETDPFDSRRLYRGPAKAAGSTRETYQQAPRQIDRASEVKRRRRRRK
jgi:hypothetical protein